MYNGVKFTGKVRAIPAAREPAEEGFGMKLVKALTAALLLAIAACGACLAAEQAVNPAAPSPDMQLMPGDALYIRIPAEPALSGEYKVAENGKIYFPVLETADLGSISVIACKDMKTGKTRGCTVAEAEAMIKAKLGNYFVDATVVVELMSFSVRAANTIAIYGQLQSPGAYSHFEGMRLLDAFIKAGSISPDADLKNVRLLRDDLTIAIDASGVINGTDMAQNLVLQPRDYIIVPSREPIQKVKVLVLGQVSRVGSFYLPEGATVLDALAAAGGAQGRAGVGKSYIIRMVDNRPTAVPVDIKALISRLDLEQNRELLNNDVLFVPESSGINLNEIMSNLSMFNLLTTTYDDAIE
jgi:protein involved in polysaccharide export with SLBB domain